MDTSQDQKTNSLIREIKTRIVTYDANADVSMIDRAHEMAARLYGNVCTPDGRPLILHFTEVALELTGYGQDINAISAAILRDAIRYGAKPAEIEAAFNPVTRELAELLDQLGIIRFYGNEEEQTLQLRQMFVAMARNVSVILIEIAGRVVFMKYIGAVKDRKFVETYAAQSLEIFSPLAHRLGVAKLKSEMEDLCFKILNPAEFERLNRLAGKTKKQREDAVSRIGAQMKDIFEERGLQANITGRTKHLYSTYEKMLRQGKDFSELYDLAAVRVITSTVDECYQALAILHSTWSPVHVEFDDYIAHPKHNGYQSIHTVVKAPNGQPVEVQIRTWEMHMTSEYGVAAHWRYKENMAGSRDPGEDLITWIRRFTSDKRDAASTREHLSNVVIDPMEEKVFALSPLGRIVRLPSGSTPIDFAYRIHTSVGNRCQGAKVNGRIVPLDYVLRNGDVVDIITRKVERPSRDWLRIAASSSTRSKIRTWFRHADRDENIMHGRTMLGRELDRHGLRRADLLDQIGFGDVLKTYNYNTEEDLYAAIGCGDVNIEGVATRLRKKYRDLLEQESAEPEKPVVRKTRRKKKTQDIVAEGLTGVMVTFAKCCLPVPREPVSGFVTRTRGLTIHRNDCPNIKASLQSGERLVKVAWGETLDNTYLTDIVVNVISRVGMLNDILAIITEAGINISNSKSKMLANGTSLISLRMEVTDKEKLDYIIRRISSVEDVLSVSRKG